MTVIRDDMVPAPPHAAIHLDPRVCSPLESQMQGRRQIGICALTLQTHLISCSASVPA